MNWQKNKNGSYDVFYSGSFNETNDKLTKKELQKLERISKMIQHNIVKLIKIKFLNGKTF